MAEKSDLKSLKCGFESHRDYMPFKSEKQRQFLWARHPEIAKRWTKKYGAASKIQPKAEAIKRRLKGR
jgi:hypothetical protein